MPSQDGNNVTWCHDVTVSTLFAKLIASLRLFTLIRVK